MEDPGADAGGADAIPEVDQQVEVEESTSQRARKTRMITILNCAQQEG